MKIPSLFKNKEAKQTWQWPSCKQPKTLSFRDVDHVFKTVNSVFLDLESPDSLFTSSSECASISTEEENKNNNSDESLEMIIQGVRLSERLFFEPGDTSSILKEEGKTSTDHDSHDNYDINVGVVLPFKESVALAMESDNPYVDFKKSMQEMVESHGLKDWDCLEELLAWYLKMNGKMNHEFIVGAFVDLLMGLDFNSTTSSSSVTIMCCSDHSTAYSSVDSSFSSPSSPISPNVVVVGHEDRDTS
ncbi:hypothetical protein ACJIZ3_022755 [Penstemon smallii]|uniref:Transcription repressor n=1 Tax=Penstemon smallii TaxID=265156 RepID=A0ABD3TM46_9LAMI